MKALRSLIVAIMVSLPVIRDGNNVYDANALYGVKQVNKFVLLLSKYQDDPIQLSFDSVLEANHFVDIYQDWLATKK